MTTVPLAPPWVEEETGVSTAILFRWRQRGWLTPPGTARERRRRTNPGPGNPFDWHAALPQIAWLDRLRWQNRFDPDRPICDMRASVDRLDAEGGWQLRAEGAAYAVRVDRGRWRPLDDPTHAAELLAGATIVTVVHVNGGTP